jgi:hypothetical protein
MLLSIPTPVPFLVVHVTCTFCFTAENGHHWFWPVDDLSLFLSQGHIDYVGKNDFTINNLTTHGP